MTTEQILWSIGTYVIASIPFSVLIGQFVFGLDIRQYGDGNPGATNVKRATGSTTWFIIAMIFDCAKGLFPVGIAYWLLGWQDGAIVVIVTMALLGHAFSLFLRFRGGKGIAITWGVWIGLTLFESPVVMSILLVYCFMSVDKSNWAVVLWWIAYLGYLLLAHSGNSTFLTIWAINAGILLYRHRAGLTELPNIRRWLPLLPKQPQVVSS